MQSMRTRRFCILAKKQMGLLAEPCPPCAAPCSACLPGVAHERAHGLFCLLEEPAIWALCRGRAALLAPEVYGRGY
jgi:hypothetical protein